MPVSLSQPAISTQFVQVQVIATNLDGSAYDPSGDTVQMAFILGDLSTAEPGPSDWIAAEWEAGPSASWWATILVGPANGGTVLEVATYTVWVKVTDSPAVPALPGPLLSIF